MPLVLQIIRPLYTIMCVFCRQSDAATNLILFLTVSEMAEGAGDDVWIEVLAAAVPEFRDTAGPASPPRVAAAAISSLAILVHFTKPRNSIEG